MAVPTPYSYRQYAGDGTTKDFSVPFPYLVQGHVKLYTGYNILDGTFTTLLVEGTDYVWTSGTQVQLTVAPAAGVMLTVLRDTPGVAQLVPWQDGSYLIAEDLNLSDLQNLYVVQEQRDRNSAGADASSNAEAAAAAAVIAANEAKAEATTALGKANDAMIASGSAVSTAGEAKQTAEGAAVMAESADQKATTAMADSTTALTTANTALSNANTAGSKADQALAAVANVVLYTPVANVGAIPTAPADGDAVEVMDSTGIESFTPLTGVPAGFVGDSGLSAQITYSAAAGSWQWVRYAVVDPENRYGEAITSLVSDVIVLGDTKLDKTEAASTYQTQAGMSSYLTTASAAATYQTQAGMSAYLPRNIATLPVLP